MNRNTEETAPSFIPFARPSLGPEERDLVIRVLESGWLTSGRYAEEFEKAFQEYLGVPFARAVNSATAGLHLSLEALGIQPDTWVITSPYTFTATAEVLRYLGAHPLFVDIEPQTLNLDPRGVEEALERSGKPISAILPVHLAGRMCSMEPLTDLSRRFGIPLVEDAAHAFPVYQRGKAAGTFGNAGVFSFYATKTITTGEGGMVVTPSEKIAERVSMMRLHGIDRKAWDRYTSNRRQAWEYDVVAAGYKYNLSDLCAALGLEQLKKADSFLRRRKEIAAFYFEQLADQDYLLLPEKTPEHAWHLFILQLLPDALTLDRNAFADALLARGIGTSVHYKPLHMMTYYRNLYGYKPEDFPVSLRTYQHCLSLPIYPGLRDVEAERVVEAVRAVGRQARR
ncbi:MAG: DegT/DnrJ/EryC1/StrS family aminotransferase [Spirochaetales bacterium]|nr:DegT/DnrJ/EryC1/StrS family aminotransferase [Spirochaetales bacterium]